MLREKIRITYLRMTQFEPPQMPHHPPIARRAILELSTARRWSLEQTAEKFLRTVEAISPWVLVHDETGTTALAQIAQLVTRYPSF